MPSKSDAQKRLMQAAARTPGGFGGVPQKVGREFAAADAEIARKKAAKRQLDSVVGAAIGKHRKDLG